MGVSVESADYKLRVDLLRETKAQVKFISFEPLIDSVGKINLNNIDWAIVGGESGPGARYMSPEWVADLRDQCLVQKVPFFFKQWGGINKKKAGRLLDGRTWNEMPVVEIVEV
jgi:protein gp37